MGLTKRSTAQEGKVGANTLGALHVRNEAGVDFHIGAGFTEALRAQVWAHREDYMGRIVKMKHQPYGAKDAPRLPVFLGFRSLEDL